MERETPGLVRDTAEIALRTCGRADCGVQFEPKARQQKFCSTACRMKNYRANPNDTPAKIVKRQRRDSRMKLKLERHFRPKATVPSAPSSHAGRRFPLSGSRGKLKDPDAPLKQFPEPTPRLESDAVLDREIENLQKIRSRVSVSAPQPSSDVVARRMDCVGVDVVGANTMSRLQEAISKIPGCRDIPGYLMPVVLDVQLRRGSAWDAVQRQREYDACDEPALIGPCLEDGSFRSARRFDGYEKRPIGPRHEDGSFVQWKLRLQSEPSEPIDTSGHPATIKKTLRRTLGSRQYVT